MKVDPKIKYKSETGNLPFIRIESEYSTDQPDSNDTNYKESVHVQFLPAEYWKSNYYNIPTLEYVEWLESKFDNDLL